LVMKTDPLEQAEEEDDSEASQSQSQRSVPLVDQFTGISIKVTFRLPRSRVLLVHCL